MSISNAEILRRTLKRRKFSGLMDLYDRNYTLLLRLAPELRRLPPRSVSQVPGSPDLYLEIQEHCKFTLMLRLTYYFTHEKNNSSETIADPDLHIRFYSDARVVEAVSCRPQGFMALVAEPGTAPQLLCRWESNLFLQKWMEYAISLGHCFSASSVGVLVPATKVRANEGIP